MKKPAQKKSESASAHFCAFLRSSRTARGMSQAALASALGYESAQFISDWERGVSSPPLKKIARIAILLEVDMDRLFDLMVDVATERVADDLQDQYSRIRKRSR